MSLQKAAQQEAARGVTPGEVKHLPVLCPSSNPNYDRRVESRLDSQLIHTVSDGDVRVFGDACSFGGVAVRESSAAITSSQEVQSLLDGQLLLVYVGSSCDLTSIVSAFTFMTFRSSIKSCLSVREIVPLPCRCHPTKTQCTVSTQEGQTLISL